MQKITNWIFNQSPRKLAICLVLGPLLLFLAHTLITILVRNISETSTTIETISNIVLGVLFLILATLVLLWLFWLRSTVYSVEKSDLGLPLRWFNIAFVVFAIYLLYNLCFSHIEHIDEGYQHIFYALNEFIGFGGLLIAYPLICYYSARGISAKKGNKPATFVSALPFALVLVFGAVLGIPFFHKYFSTKTSTNSEVVIIYGIGIGLCIVLFVVGFLAAITGLV